MIIEIYATQHFQDNIKDVIFPSYLMLVKTISPMNKRVYLVCANGKILGYLGDKSYLHLINDLNKLFILTEITSHPKYKNNLLLEIDLSKEY